MEYNMAKIPLFDNWTWKLDLPQPFEHLTEKVSKIHYSTYCTVATKKSTLHGPLLSAVFAYMDIDTTLTPAPVAEHAIGTQDDKIVSEYHSRTKQIHVVYFNRKTGKFNAGRYDEPSSNPRSYSIKDSQQTGTALFFALMPLAMEDEEFKENYYKLGHCRNTGYPDMDEATQAAFILCDNLYRRIESADKLPSVGIQLNIQATKNIPALTPLGLQRNTYSPSSILFGTFQILTGSSSTTAAVTINQNDFVNHYPLSERTFTPQEQLLIPRLEDWYIIPPEVITICKHAHQTTSGVQPMRNFMMRGPAGTGKTEGAKAIAAGLGLPYLYLTCSANSEIYDFMGQMLPDTVDSKPYALDYPTLIDIQMDPPSAYQKLTGIYDETITDTEVYNKLLEVMEHDAKALAEKNSTGQRFRYVETPLITAIRNGYLIEIQEPTVIANPGVLVGLNALLDRCSSITLTTGEVIHRHPDTVIVITTNNNYAGCRDLNQSIISRMNLIMDMDAPDTRTLTERVMKVTGCTDEKKVTDMAEAVQEITEHCKNSLINDGSCGGRELISWVQSYMVCGDVLEAAKYTVLSSVSSDPENRADILSTCLEQKFAA